MTNYDVAVGLRIKSQETGRLVQSTELGTNREQIGNKLPKNTGELGRTTRT